MVPFRCKVEMARVRDMADVLRTIPPQAMDKATEVADTEFRRLESKLFESEGESGEQPWAPLKPGYAAWKERWRSGRIKERKAQRNAASWFAGATPKLSALGANKILQLTGAMKRALTTKAAEHISYWFRNAAGQHVIQVGVEGRSGRIATYHDQGNAHMQARPPIIITPDQSQVLHGKIFSTLVPFLIRGFKAAARLGRLGGTYHG